MKSISLALLAFGVTATSVQAGEHLVRGFAVYYQQKVYFTDYSDFDGVNASAPDLGSNARLHGAEVEGFISNNIIFGMYGNGMLNRERSSSGSSDWGGGIAALFGQYRIYGPLGLFASAGFGLGCGRIDYIASNAAGTNTQSIVSDAIYAEPLANIGYTYHDKIHLRLQASYIVPGLGNNYRTGSPDLDNPFPNGPVVGLSLGYRFPYFE